jgi:ankyrin repeat protein
VPSVAGLRSEGGYCELVERHSAVFGGVAGQLSVLKLLVEKGTDVRLNDKDGQTASDLARSVGKEDVADWLDLVSCG